jgi:transcription elongation factor Elf1
MEFTKEFKEKIVKELDEKIEKLNKNFQCPICKHKNFNVVDGFTKRNIDKNLSVINFGMNIPSISIVCTNCGYIADFAIGALGFLPNKGEEEKKDGKTKN